MSKTTQELKHAVEARIDIEQRRLILQILSREDTLDEPTTDKLQQLMREVERREQAGESAATPQPFNPLPPAPERAAGPGVPSEPAAAALPVPPEQGMRADIEAPKPADGASREEELAELERKNVELSQLLEQLTREKQHTLVDHLSQDAELGAGEFAYHAHHITDRLNKDEPGWFRMYLPLILLVILIGLGAWAFFTFVPLQPTL